MKIVLRTQVDGAMKNVFQSFDKNLFDYLLPRGATIKRFDGSSPGDIVHLQFTIPLKAEWISEITQEYIGNHTCYFIDCGVKLPFGLKYWRHVHYVHHDTKVTSIIEDDMEFRTSNVILDFLMYPFLYLAFLPRKRQYRKYFQNAGAIKSLIS
jgi:hypothetical protein